MCLFICKCPNALGSTLCLNSHHRWGLHVITWLHHNMDMLFVFNPWVNSLEFPHKGPGITGVSFVVSLNMLLNSWAADFRHHDSHVTPCQYDSCSIMTIYHYHYYYFFYFSALRSTLCLSNLCEWSKHIIFFLTDYGRRSSRCEWRGRRCTGHVCLTTLYPSTSRVSRTPQKPSSKSLRTTDMSRRYSMCDSSSQVRERVSQGWL